MSQIIYSDQATIDLVRLADFIGTMKPSLRKRTLKTIVDGIDRLKTFPKIAKPSQIEKYKHMRELFIPFGKNGYAVLYKYQVM